MNEAIRVRPREADEGASCLYCRQTAGPEARGCSGCGALYHPECLRELRGQRETCPTPGCQQELVLLAAPEPTAPAAPATPAAPARVFQRPLRLTRGPSEDPDPVRAMALGAALPAAATLALLWIAMRTDPASEPGVRSAWLGFAGFAGFVTVILLLVAGGMAWGVRDRRRP